jgi:hypothetical protein
MADDKDERDGWRVGWVLSRGFYKRFYEAYGKERGRSGEAISLSEFAEQVLGMGLEELKNGKGAA